MAQGVIYMVDGEGLKRMAPSAPESEDRMQQLVALYPELITDGDGDLLLIRREHAVGDGAVDARWSVDHLFVTREGVPVLVELKRAVDTRLRREVVGQMLDYAANATAHWQAGTIARSFAATAGDDADGMLARFIGDRAPEEFWAQVDSNLRAGRVKLVFVADVIPRELALIVEFLNGQMRADVRAVELRWFAGEGGITTLNPRVIGETERVAAAKASSGALPPIAVRQWIDDRIGQAGDDVLRGVDTFIAMVEEEGGVVFVPSTQGSLVVRFALANGKLLYPFGVSPHGRIKLLLGYLLNRPAYKEEAARASLYAKLSEIVGGLHTRSLTGEPGFSASLLQDDGVARSVRTLLAEIVDTVRQAEGYGSGENGI
jgi:hypothetical protein